MKKLFLVLTLCGTLIVPALADDVLFSWTSNSSTEMVSSYIIQYIKAPSTNWTTAVTIPGTTNTALIKGIVRGVQYQFRVFANNGKGQGEPSDTLNIPDNTPTKVLGFQYTLPN